MLDVKYHSSYFEFNQLFNQEQRMLIFRYPVFQAVDCNLSLDSQGLTYEWLEHLIDLNWLLPKLVDHFSKGKNYQICLNQIHIFLISTQFLWVVYRWRNENLEQSNISPSFFGCKWPQLVLRSNIRTTVNFNAWKHEKWNHTK